MREHDGCPRCTQPLDPPEGRGHVLLRFPTEHAFAKVRTQLVRDHAPHRRDGDSLEITIEDRELADVLADVQALLTVGERAASRSLFVPAGKTLTTSDYLDVESIDRHLGRLQGRWLRRMIHEDSFTSVFQPICSLDASLTVAGHECLVRGIRGDEIIAPATLIEVAGRADMLSAFDHAARRSAVRTLAKHPAVPLAFINVSPRAIYDSETCLQPTVDQLDAIRFPHDRVVFEIIESDWADPGVLTHILSFYRAKGFRVALDDLGAGFASFTLLESLRPDIIKVDMQFIRGVDLDPYRAAIAEKLIETAHQLGILAVAEGVETAGELAWVRAHGADFAQGFLLGRPTPVPQLVSIAS